MSDLTNQALEIVLNVRSTAEVQALREEVRALRAARSSEVWAALILAFHRGDRAERGIFRDIMSERQLRPPVTFANRADVDWHDVCTIIAREGYDVFYVGDSDDSEVPVSMNVDNDHGGHDAGTLANLAARGWIYYPAQRAPVRDFYRDPYLAADLEGMPGLLPESESEDSEDSEVD